MRGIILFGLLKYINLVGGRYYFDNLFMDLFLDYINTISLNNKSKRYTYINEIGI